MQAGGMLVTGYPDTARNGLLMNYLPTDVESFGRYLQILLPTE